MENMLSMLSDEEANFILDSLFNEYGFDRWKFDFNTCQIRLWKKDDDFSCYWLGYELNGSFAAMIMLTKKESLHPARSIISNWIFKLCKEEKLYIIDSLGSSLICILDKKPNSIEELKIMIDLA